LRHRLTLNCASPEDRRRRTWDVLEGDLCTDTIISVEIPKITNLTVSSRASPNITTDTGPALSITSIVVIVIVVVCVLVGGVFIVVKLMKKLRKSSELPVHYEVCVDQNETVCLVPTS
jgi:beta-lactamase regulating signal transducer with metallopeptidase domain